MDSIGTVRGSTINQVHPGGGRGYEYDAHQQRLEVIDVDAWAESEQEYWGAWDGKFYVKEEQW